MEPAEYETLFEQEERFWWYRGLRRLALAQLRRALRPGGARILDAGCGTGGMLARMEPLGEVAGIDMSPLALAFCRRRTAAPLARASVSALPFATGAFDGIVSLDVLYHRAVKSDLEALREFRRCLRPGGVLVLNLPAFDSLRSSHDRAIHTARRYRRAPLIELLCAAGLQPLRVTYWNTLLFPGLAAVRRLRRGGASGEASGNASQAANGSTSDLVNRNASEVASDVRPLPAPIDRGLGAVLAVERAWVDRHDLPFGLSLLAVARRPTEPAP